MGAIGTVAPTSTQTITTGLLRRSQLRRRREHGDLDGVRVLEDLDRRGRFPAARHHAGGGVRPNFQGTGGELFRGFLMAGLWTRLRPAVACVAHAASSNSSSRLSTLPWWKYGAPSAMP